MIGFFSWLGGFKGDSGRTCCWTPSTQLRSGDARLLGWWIHGGQWKGLLLGLKESTEVRFGPGMVVWLAACLFDLQGRPCHG